MHGILSIHDLSGIDHLSAYLALDVFAYMILYVDNTIVCECFLWCRFMDDP